MVPLDGLLILDIFSTVIEKLPLSLHDWHGIGQRNRDLQGSGIRCQSRFEKRISGQDRVSYVLVFLQGEERKKTEELHMIFEFR